MNMDESWMKCREMALLGHPKYVQKCFVAQGGAGTSPGEGALLSFHADGPKPGRHRPSDDLRRTTHDLGGGQSIGSGLAQNLKVVGKFIFN